MIFIRVDGANIEGIGMGHLYRMIFMADHLHQKTGIQPMFVISGYQETKDLLDYNNLKYIEVNNKDEANEILKLNSSSKKDILIIDMMEKDEEIIKRIREKFIVISFDDIEGGTRYSDIVFNSVVGAPLKRENYFYGPDYFLIRSEIKKYNVRDKAIPFTVKNLLIYFGGSDLCQINSLMIDWLRGFQYSGKIKWVLGPAVPDKDLIKERLKKINLDIVPLIDYKYMGKLYYNADLCVCAAGFGLYEIACTGLPAITICLYPHQIKTARKFEEKGLVCNLGYYKAVNGIILKKAICKLVTDQPLRSSMSKNGKTFVDGLGIERVMGKLNKFL